MAEARPFSPLSLRAIEAGIPRPWLAVIEGALLRKLRREAGLSQARLAERADVSVNVVARLEGLDEGRCRPPTGVRLAQALGVDTVALVRELVHAPGPQMAPR